MEALFGVYYKNEQRSITTFVVKYLRVFARDRAMESHNNGGL